MTTEANTPTDDSNRETASDVTITTDGETIPVEGVSVSSTPSDDFEYKDLPIPAYEHEYTGSFTFDLRHADDRYQVDDATHDATTPTRPRPAVDPHVAFTTVGHGSVAFTVMQDATDMEAFILGEPSAWITLDEMA